MVRKVKSHSGEIIAFGNLLCAMYNRPYKLRCINDLRSLVRVADFYCALPIVSNTITAAILESQILLHANRSWEDFHGHIYSELLVLAKKLRNPYLFRICFVHVVALFCPDPVTKDIFLAQDMQLNCLVLSQYGLVCSLKQRVHQILLRELFSGKLNPADLELPEHLVALMKYTLPRAFYVRLHDMVYNEISGSGLGDLEHALNDLLVNNLPPSGLSGGPQDRADKEDEFYCAKIKDEDLPWDPEETDW